MNELFFTKEEDLLSKLFYNYTKSIILGSEITDSNILNATLELEQVPEWKKRLGFDLQIRSNDHFEKNANGDYVPHLHFYNTDKSIHFKLDFNGCVLKKVGVKNIPKNVNKKILKFFKYGNIQITLTDLWNKNNPELKLK